MLGLTLLLPIMVLLPGASAHGASVEMTADAGPYHVVFYTYDAITASEVVRLSWNVTDAASRERVHIADPRAEVRSVDAQGRLANRTEYALQQRVDGFLFTDVMVGPEGRMESELLLENGTSVPFSQPVFPASTAGRYDKGTPGPAAALACAALALGCALTRGARLPDAPRRRPATVPAAQR
jgi:hypothetical protein